MKLREIAATPSEFSDLDASRAIVELLLSAGQSGLPAGVIAGDLDVSPVTLAGDMAELFTAGYVECEMRGRQVYFRANPNRVFQAVPDRFVDSAGPSD